jgi:hypothetical protein
LNKESPPSPREEALEIAYQTRKAILSGKSDPVAILRACLVIATELGKKPMVEWISNELSGYKTTNIPKYRVHNCPITRGNYHIDAGFRVYPLTYDIHFLMYFCKKNESLEIALENRDKEGSSDEKLTLHVSPSKIESTLAGIVDKCFLFLNDIITELQYGGVVEYLMEEIRRTTDEKLATFDVKITEETQSLYLSLTSTNPADWSKVGHSCRKILKLLADSIFEPSDEKYSTKDGRTLEVTEQCVINRLYAFLDKNLQPDEKKFIGAQIDYLESYLRGVVNYAQMAEHNPSIEKFHANMLAIHTYLVISDILRHVQDNPDS